MAVRNYSNTAQDTTLNGSITDVATTATVTADTGWPAAPFTILIENEVILVGARTGTSLSSLTRGYDGTVAASHADTTAVKVVVVAQDFEDAATAIHTDVSAEISALTEKTTPVSADLLVIEDSAASNAKKKVQIGNLPGGGGVPGWIAYLNARQTGETSHTDDDFFTDGSLAGTAVTGAGSATWVEKYDRMSVYCSGQGAFPSEIAARVFSLTPSSAPVTLETRFSALWSGDVTVGRSRPAVMVGFSDGALTSSTIVGIYMYSDPGNDGMPAYDIGGTFAAVTSGTVRPEFSDLVQSLVVRVVWTGTNSFSYSTSVDGIQFVEHVTLAQTLTPTHFFVGAGNADTAVPRQVSFDYVRINEADLTGA